MNKVKTSRKPQANKKDVFSFIIIRLIIITALIISAVTVQFSTATFLVLHPFYSLIILVYILTAAYLGLYFWGKYYTCQVYLQIGFDLLIITALVYMSGGLEGSFYFLYVFEIIAAGIILSQRAAYITAALSAVYFGALVDGLFLGLIPYYGVVPLREITQMGVLSNLFIAWGTFFIVAFLINYLKKKLRNTHVELQQAQRELDVKRRLAVAGEVSAQVSHEIRNPLAAISGSIQVLRGELDLSEEQKKLMDIVVKESDRAASTLDQFLSLTVPKSQDNSRINLSEVCLETLHLMQRSGEMNGHCRVNGNFRSSDLCFYGNKNQFKQIFWNIIKNAVKAMQDYGTLTIDFFLQTDDWIQLRFKDTGQGMTEEIQQRIFEPFYTGFHTGKGIGMTVVKRIVEDYEGRIEVFSKSNEGTEVIIALPQRKREDFYQLDSGG
ncbi:MAG: ATP-binding protein [Candidatus Aminicenantes bacterium]|jgi:two-component system sensor histidine kinase PilS (NtrC family)